MSEAGELPGERAGKTKNSDVLSVFLVPLPGTVAYVVCTEQFPYKE